MKKLKNNKGITGVDITTSIIVIIIGIGIISAMFTRYIDNTKKVKRSSEATNLAIGFVQYIEKTDFDVIDKFFDADNDGIDETKRYMAEAEDDIIDLFGIEIKNFLKEIPSGFTVILERQKIDGIAMKVDVRVLYDEDNSNYNYYSYDLDKVRNKVSLSKIKIKSISQVNLPNMEAEQVRSNLKEGYTRYALKYSNAKDGYIQGKFFDNDWYSISYKRYPIVAYAKKEAFDVNGVINFDIQDKISDIYIWVPRFGKIDEKTYGFCYEKTDNMIVYSNTGNKITNQTIDNVITYDIIGYTVSTSILTDIPEEFVGVTGKWVKVNSNFNPIDDLGNEITDENNILNILKTKTFTWN